MPKKAKRRPYTIRPSRNALCPCGSGRAYKNCCAGREAASAVTTRKSYRWQIFVVAAFAVAIAGGLGLTVLQSKGGGASGPEPWEYDAETDRYWHAGHGHWHDGEPPPESMRW